MRYALMAALLSVIGCGGGSGTADAGAFDPVLLGNWNATITTGPDMQLAGFTFGNDGLYGLSHSQLNPASSSDHAGCRQLDVDTGTYTVVRTSNGTGTFTTAPTSSTRTYTDCTNASDNGTGPSTIFQPGTTYTYSIQGNVMTATPTGGTATMFMRGT
jgi:hypothetical protein